MNFYSWSYYEPTYLNGNLEAMEAFKHKEFRMNCTAFEHEYLGESLNEESSNRIVVNHFFTNDSYKSIHQPIND